MRHPWIPPRPPRRTPSTRPVTILDTPPADGGYEYRASWCGVPLQVFSQPPVTGNLLQAGDTIIARWIPTAGQLWFPSPEIGARLFFWPGRDKVDNRAHFYEYNGASITERWVAPLENGLTYITWAGWFQGQIILCTCDFSDLDLVTGVKLYSLNPATWVATDLGFAAVMNPGGDSSYNYYLDGAEFNGCLYLAGFYDGPLPPDAVPEVIRYDPIGGTLTQVDTGPFGWTPAIAVWPGPIPKLIWSDGYVVRESTDGAIWANNYDFAALEGSFDQGSMHTNLADTSVILGGNRNPAGPPPDEGIAWETADGVNWTAFLLGAAGDRKMYVGVGMEYPGAAVVPDYLYALEWANDNAKSPNVHRRPAAGGPWVLDWTGPGVLWETPQGEALASIAGKVVAIFVDSSWRAERTVVYERTLAGVWQQLQLYNCDHLVYNVTTHGAGVIRAAPGLKCQEA